MAFSKTFPKTIPGTNYPIWEEVYLTEEEEKEVEEQCKKENFLLMDESIVEARQIAIKRGMNEEDIVSRLAVSLFEKKASHVVFWKESKAKDKFDQKNKQ
ncbi:hypothetical protein COY27_05400 [Candidatus Woesearchaeota archaeon CG_4_10_14_0_2_um_filter_33_13]|nr:MAG: hypothetical protein COY27_05400 [Candidatus Woesearchaeota archaeon CG_4_10_14_0_2_um_filter_33_13]